VAPQEEPYPSNKKADALSKEELTEQLVLGFTRIRGRAPTDKEREGLAQGAYYAKHEQGHGMNWTQLLEALKNGNWDPATDTVFVLRSPL
jgi:hypothetical protein